MLTTEEADGSMRSRPLATLQLDSEGRLWFFTGLSSGKTAGDAPVWQTLRLLTLNSRAVRA